MINLEWIIIIILIFFICITYILIILGRHKRKIKPERARFYKCIDGHTVRSRAELIIDNLLMKLGIEHIYEKPIIKGRNEKYDWFLPKLNIYIEYWGLNNKEYLKKKDEKIKMYKKNKLKLISIEDIDLANIYENFPKKLTKFTKNTNVKFGKYCPNCGKKLDLRF
ncbi:MAG: helicase IV [Candidatus Helarchaeota archaeon]